MPDFASGTAQVTRAGGIPLDVNLVYLGICEKPCLAPPRGTIAEAQAATTVAARGSPTSEDDDDAQRKEKPMSTYRIKSHWNASTSRLNGTTYSSLRAARAAIGSGTFAAQHGGSEYVAAWSIYSSRADAHTDRYGAAPYLAIAVIEKLSARDLRRETEDWERE